MNDTAGFRAVVTNAPASRELGPAQLCRHCEPGGLPFRSTEELEDLDLTLGQARAVDAIRFGVGMARDGYNLFAMGPEGVGRHTIVRRYLGREAPRAGPMPDWCMPPLFAF